MGTVILPKVRSVVGKVVSVTGRLIPSKTSFVLKGLMVRLDNNWNYIVEADAEGKFTLPYVHPGKHRLTAYLPNNLRGDRGIGHVEISVEQGKPVENIEIQLETLAEVRVQFLNADGNPLEGITAGATWTKSGQGFWTEGARSDADGWAVLYMYPDQTQYVRGFDHSGRSLIAEGFEQVKPKVEQVIDNLRIIMVPTAKLRGQLALEDGSLLTEKRLLCKLNYADGIERKRPVKVDVSGRFELDKLPPGVVKLTVETHPLEFSSSLAAPVEIKPGEDKDIGNLLLTRVPTNL